MSRRHPRSTRTDPLLPSTTLFRSVPPGRTVDYHLGQRDRRLGAMTDVGVVVGQLLRLLGDRLGDLFAAVADVHAVEAGEGVEQAGAVAVADVDTLAAGNDARTPLAARKLREVGRGMEEAVPVPGLDRKSTRLNSSQ